METEITHCTFVILKIIYTLSTQYKNQVKQTELLLTAPGCWSWPVMSCKPDNFVKKDFFLTRNFCQK